MSEKATFGAGCFWGVEVAFRNVEGVLDAAVGYAGGSLENPTYQDVCSGTTGHAEVVEVEFDPSQVSYDALLDVFWDNHNPTQLNRQGPDVGTQYRSAIFYHTEAQREYASRMIQRLGAEKVFDRPIVTELAPLETFYPAEPHHQEFYRRNPGQAYCQVVVGPKVAKFRKNFQDRLKKEFAS